jgi:Mn2+/Fe2+ NRAMP family transporter
MALLEPSWPLPGKGYDLSDARTRKLRIAAGLLLLTVVLLGAAAEIALALSFEVTQIMGWKYGEDRKPKEAAVFNLIFLVYIVGSTLLMGLTGMDPLQLTILSVVFTALVLPAVVVPFLAVMKDPAYLKDQTNGLFSNGAVSLIVLLTFVLSAESIPVTILTGGG